MPTCRTCSTVDAVFYHNASACVSCVKKRYRTGKGRELAAKMSRVKCMDCDLVVTPETHLAFEWDHREQKDKKFSVCQMATCSNETFYKEIDKCDLVCVLHHRLRSIHRLNNGMTVFKSPRGRPRKLHPDRVGGDNVEPHVPVLPALTVEGLTEQCCPADGIHRANVGDVLQ